MFHCKLGVNSCQILYSHLPICFHQSTDPLGFFLNTNIFLHFVFSDQTSLLEFLHILTTNHKLVFAPVNNEPDFIAGLCHWLLVMGTHKSLSAGENNKKPEGDSLILLCKVIGHFRIAFSLFQKTSLGAHPFI